MHFERAVTTVFKPKLLNPCFRYDERIYKKGYTRTSKKKTSQKKKKAHTQIQNGVTIQKNKAKLIITKNRINRCSQIEIIPNRISKILRREIFLFPNPFSKYCSKIFKDGETSFGSFWDSFPSVAFTSINYVSCFVIIYFCNICTS